MSKKQKYSTILKIKKDEKQKEHFKNPKMKYKHYKLRRME